MNKGVTLQCNGKYEDALECFNEGLKTNSKDVDTWGNKVSVLINLERFEEAMRCVNTTLELDPKNPMNWMRKGMLLDFLGKKGR